MENDPINKIYGVLGNPAKHSLSPLMHNAAFSTLKIDAEYKIFEVEPQNLGNFILSLSKEGIFGLNVTVPYKEKVIPYLQNISDEAKLIGAVNTIKVLGENLEGFNTDGEGFLKHVSEDLRFSPEGKSIAIIGAGGAARAVSICLSKRNPKRISIYDIDGVKLLSLINYLKENFKDIEFNSVSSPENLGINNSDLLINATAIGMKEADPCLVDEKSLHKDLLVYDLIYNPGETKLLVLAKRAGAKTSNGLGMLLYQGMAAFEIWTGKKAPKEVMKKALWEGMKNK